MKTIPITIILICISIISFSQKKKLRADDIYFAPQIKESVFNKQQFDVKNTPTELAWIKECLNNYQKQRKTAFYLHIAGTLTTSSALLINDKQSQNIAFISGGVLNFAALITFIDADKFLKRASFPKL